jgi:hypothetical protein
LVSARLAGAAPGGSTGEATQAAAAKAARALLMRAIRVRSRLFFVVIPVVFMIAMRLVG